MIKQTLTIIAATALLAGCTIVPPRDDAPEIRIEDIDAFLAHQDYLVAGMQDGSLGAFTDRQIEDVIHNREILRRELSRVETIDELSLGGKIAVFNAQGTINGIVTDSMRDTTLCTRETVVGSRRVQTVCMSARAREKLREDSQRSLRYLQRAPMPGGGGGSGSGRPGGG
jgi:hypothetical protein